jgi:sporulation protein YlmC with PRC-barrel domain
MKVTDFLGKKVLDKNAMEIGKVSEMEIDPLKGLIKTITISKSDISLKTKTFMISVEELDKVGDYVIITLASEDAEHKEDDSEMESVSISLEKDE